MVWSNHNQNDLGICCNYIREDLASKGVQTYLVGASSDFPVINIKIKSEMTKMIILTSYLLPKIELYWPFQNIDLSDPNCLDKLSQWVDVPDIRTRI